MTELLVDSDVFIDHLRGARRLAIGRDQTVHYSVITRCELFAGPEEQEMRVRRLLAPFREIGIDAGIAELAGRLRRSSGARTPDALIAATALARGLTLITRNLRDFESIARLLVRAP